MKPSCFKVAAFLLGFVACNCSLQAALVTVTGGTLTFDLDGEAFANNPDSAWLSGFGITPTAQQTWLEFAKHNQSTPAGRPDTTSTDFNDLRTGWTRPSSTGLAYDFNPNTSVQTFNFDPATIATSGGAGDIRFLGGDSFWFANQAAIDTGSVWIQYGNLGLNYDALRNDGTNTGWLFTNFVADPTGSVDVFDIRNLSLTLGANSLTMTGDLFVNEGFRDFTGVAAGLDVGSFTFNGITAVPEPSSSALLGAAGVAGAVIRRRRQSKSAPVIG